MVFSLHLIEILMPKHHVREGKCWQGCKDWLYTCQMHLLHVKYGLQTTTQRGFLLLNVFAAGHYTSQQDGGRCYLHLVFHAGELVFQTFCTFQCHTSLVLMPLLQFVILHHHTEAGGCFWEGTWETNLHWLEFPMVPYYRTTGRSAKAWRMEGAGKGSSRHNPSHPPFNNYLSWHALQTHPSRGGKNGGWLSFTPANVHLQFTKDFQHPHRSLGSSATITHTTWRLEGYGGTSLMEE